MDDYLLRLLRVESSRDLHSNVERLELAEEQDDDGRRLREERSEIDDVPGHLLDAVEARHFIDLVLPVFQFLGRHLRVHMDVRLLFLLRRAETRGPSEGDLTEGGHDAGGVHEEDRSDHVDLRKYNEDQDAHADRLEALHDQDLCNTQVNTRYMSTRSTVDNISVKKNQYLINVDSITQFVCACVRACVRALRACVRACVRACMISPRLIILS